MQSPFDEKQLKELNKPLDHRFVSEREGASKKILKYITGHDAIDQADRIFGYGNWNHRTLSCDAAVVTDPVDGTPIGVMYQAMVELYVNGCSGPIIEPGFQPVASWNVQGLVESRRSKWSEQKKNLPVSQWEIDNARKTIMESYEQAGKGAATDGLKRCLRVFGEQFANSLYGDGRIEVVEDEENREEEKQAAPAASQNTTPQKQLTKITLTKEQRQAYLDENLLFCMHIKDEDFIAFCELANLNPKAKWTDDEKETAHQKLAQYAVPESMKEKYNSYAEILTAPAMQRFSKRILKKSLADSFALDVARSIETLDKAAFLAELAKQYDPENIEIKKIGAKPEYVSKIASVDHVLDCFGHPKEDKLLGEYKGFLRDEALAHPEKIKDFPAELKERHADSWKRLLTPKKEQKAS